MLREDVQAVMEAIRDRSGQQIALEETECFRLHLQYGDLRGANLHDADLRRAMLWGAKLDDAYWAKTRLDCAFLNAATLSRAQFSNVGNDPATGLTQSQLDEALGDPEDPPKLRGVMEMPRPENSCDSAANLP